jgi:hypothetical protein
MEPKKVTRGKRATISPEIVLRGFGMQALRSKYYGKAINAENPDENAPDLVSYLGTPIFSNLQFKPGEYTDKKGNIVKYGNIANPDQIEGDVFEINTVLIDVTQQKQIIKTNIQGVAGTVKEYISKGDYQLTIRGALVDQNGQRYPEEQVQQLKEYLEVETALEVASRFLDDIFDIQNIVIESFAFPQLEGTQNVQLFEVSAVSDDPIELTVLATN